MSSHRSEQPTTLRCIVASRHPDPDKTPRATPGLQVCNGHRRKVERMIAELPALYDDLGAALTSSEIRGEQGKRKHGATSTGLNINGPVIDARDEIRAELVRMVRWVIEERGLSGWPNDTIGAMAAWLLVHVDWLCAQPDADETHDNLDRLSSGCWSLAFPSGRRRIEIGECGEGGCPGTLVTITSRTADLLPETIWCDECDRKIPPSGWRKLRESLGGGGDILLTVTQACDMYAVPFRTMSRWVKDGKLADVGDSYPAKVRATDVEDILANLGVLRDSA